MSREGATFVPCRAVAIATERWGAGHAGPIATRCRCYGPERAVLVHHLERERAKAWWRWSEVVHPHLVPRWHVVPHAGVVVEGYLLAPTVAQLVRQGRPPTFAEAMVLLHDVAAAAAELARHAGFTPAVLPGEVIVHGDGLGLVGVVAVTTRAAVHGGPEAWWALLRAGAGVAFGPPGRGAEAWARLARRIATNPIDAVERWRLRLRRRVHAAPRSSARATGRRPCVR